MSRTLPLAVALALTAAACSHRGAAADSTAQAATAPAPAQGMAGMCPMSVPGTKVSAEDTTDGAALTFTTAPEQVQSLREKVAAMAAMHNRHHAAGAGGQGAAAGGMHGGMHGDAQGSAGAGGMHGDGHGHGGHAQGGMAGHAMPPPSRAAVEDVEGGARLLLTPTDPADLQKLQSTVRAHAERMGRDGCAMMQHGA